MHLVSSPEVCDKNRYGNNSNVLYKLCAYCIDYNIVAFLSKKKLQKYRTIQVSSNGKVDVMNICLSSSVKCDGTPEKLVSENIRLLAVSKAKRSGHQL